MAYQLVIRDDTNVERPQGVFFALTNSKIIPTSWKFAHDTHALNGYPALFNVLLELSLKGLNVFRQLFFNLYLGKPSRTALQLQNDVCRSGPSVSDVQTQCCCHIFR